MRPLLAISMTIVVALTVTSPAFAKTPKFGPLTIVPGTSIGGVKVGMTKAKAVAVWGKPDSCVPGGSGAPDACNYTAASTVQGNTYVQPFATFFLKSGRVVAVDIESAENTAVDAKVKKVKTAKGIHVLSTMTSALKAYNIKRAGLGEAGLSRAQIKSKGRCTQFYAPDQPYESITSITVGICKSTILLYF
jgi:hypothetical protein